MLNITCKGGDIRQVAEGTTIDALCRDISMGLYRAACAAKLNGKTVDLRTPLTEDGAVDILTFDDEDGKKAYWHTTSHIMAQAVGRLWPGTKLTIGPSIDSGFYYDFDSEHNFSGRDEENHQGSAAHRALHLAPGRGAGPHEGRAVQVRADY